MIFQVRPLSFIQNKNPISTTTLSIEIFKNKKQFSKLIKKKKEFGRLTVFSDMSDWNPAEIIGNNPNLLDYSLYDYLIMQDNWKKGREVLGYQKMNHYPLMAKFGNKPYVDIRASFNSLIPHKIPKQLRKKLLNYYMKKFNDKPFLYDKVEFEILFTCYDFSLNSKLNKLKNFGFTLDEIHLIRNTMISFTNDIIKNFNNTVSETNYLINKMEKNRIALHSGLIDDSDNPLEYLRVASKLLEDCKNLGTKPFSTMARIAFIATALLKSLETKGAINSRFIDQFMNSLSTPLSQIKRDTVLYSQNKMSKKSFLQKYGHLRPGTYDITVKRYDQSNFFNDLSYLESSSTKTKIINIPDSILKPLIFDDIDFLEFIKLSITQREQLKFEFTKNLSDSLELISKFGNVIGFTNDEIAHLDIKFILKCKNLPINIIKEKWKKNILKQYQKKKINSNLVLPPIIFTKSDFDIIEYHDSKPNFISTKNILGKIVFFDSNKKTSLENKIILIENADPGYDWILTKNPLALITKYGGVASHMSIRCAEIGLPAAIGVGEILYEKLLNSIEVLLDCKNQKLEILKTSKHDEEVEIRKTLKSLGYIK